MSQINIRNLSNENEDGAPDIVGVSTFSATSYFVPPKGTTAQRPENPQPGDLRFNTDIASLEYFKGDTLNWSQIEMTSPDLNGGARGVIGGGYGGSPLANTNVIEYITISTLGNGTDFGDLTRTDRLAFAGVSSRTRGCWSGGFPQATQTTIDYITISQLGNAIDFGDMTLGRIAAPGVSNQTRGCYLGGYSYSPGPLAASDIIDYITIASTGNAKDFGDLTSAKEFGSQSTCASSNRGIAFRVSGNTIDYITIATTGDATDFGDVVTGTGDGAGLSNSTRGIIAGGGAPGTPTTIEYITIATLGNTTDFGDLNQGNIGGAGMSSPTRGVVGGMKNPNAFPTLDYVEIMTLGNALDFGDMTASKSIFGTVSNAHGGL